MSTTERLAEALRRLVNTFPIPVDGVEQADRASLRLSLFTAREALASWEAERAAEATADAARTSPVHRPHTAWTDADADAARLALELECLLTDRDMPTPAVSRWWESAHEALMLHRQRLEAERAAPAEPAAWMFQHGDTGRQCFCANDGVNTRENFAANNPRFVYVGPLYATPAASAEPVGATDAMPGTPAFTLAVFDAGKVPVGTQLYATPAAPAPRPECKTKAEKTAYAAGWWDAIAAAGQATPAAPSEDARDAARFRYLLGEDSDWTICEWDHDAGYWVSDQREPDVVRAAVDAAMQAQGGEK